GEGGGVNTGLLGADGERHQIARVGLRVDAEQRGVAVAVPDAEPIAAVRGGRPRGQREGGGGAVQEDVAHRIVRGLVVDVELGVLVDGVDDRAVGRKGGAQDVAVVSVQVGGDPPAAADVPDRQPAALGGDGDQGVVGGHGEGREPSVGGVFVALGGQGSAVPGPDLHPTVLAGGVEDLS